MFKLVFFLIGLGLAILFAAMNIGNVTNLSLLFVNLENIPVFFIISISFLIGAVFTLPFAFYVSLGSKRKDKKVKPKKEKKTVEEPIQEEIFGNEEI